MLRLTVSLIRILVIFRIASVFFKSIIASYSIGEGSQAYEGKRYKDAIKILKPIGNYQIKDVYVGDAQYILGVIHYYGLGIEKDMVTAISYFKKPLFKIIVKQKIYLRKLVSKFTYMVMQLYLIFIQDSLA